MPSIKRCLYSEETHYPDKNRREQESRNSHSGFYCIAILYRYLVSASGSANLYFSYI